MTSVPVQVAHGETQVSRRAEFAATKDFSIDERDSVSDASSIPLDSVWFFFILFKNIKLFPVLSIENQVKNCNEE